MQSPGHGLDAVKAKFKSMAELGRKLGLTRGAIAAWEKVPAHRVGEVSKLTGLSPAEIRPDIFGVNQ